jgi:hypothetical protein
MYGRAQAGREEYQALTSDGVNKLTHVSPCKRIAYIAHLITETVEFLTCLPALDKPILKSREDVFECQPALIRTWTIGRCAHAAKYSCRIRWDE